MQFLSPQMLWLLLLGVIPIALYLFRRHSKKVEVATLIFFKSLAQEHQESAWLRHLKKWLSLLLSLLMLALPIVLLAQLVAKKNDSDAYRTVVILLDRSASMFVKDEQGRSRLDAAKEQIREQLTELPDDVGVALIAYDSRSEVVQARTLHRRQLLSQLDAVQVRPVTENRAEALELATMIAGLETPSMIWHLSDQELSHQQANFDAPIALKEWDLSSTRAINAGITAFQIRPVPLESSRYDLFVKVALNEAAPTSQTATLTVTLGDIPIQIREVELKPGEQTGFNLQVKGVRNQELKVRLATAHDCFPLDDIVSTPLPEAHPVLAAWIRPDESEDPFTRFALSSIQESGKFELLKGSPSAWPLTEAVDVVIFDGWLPEQWPEETPALIINPPTHEAGPIKTRALDHPIPYKSIRVENEAHPVLFRVSNRRIALTQTAFIESAGLLEPLWIAGEDPVLSAGEIEGQRLVVMAVSPAASQWLPLTASFPILMGNALLWCVEGVSQREDIRSLVSGEFVHVEGESVRWTSPFAAKIAQPRSETLPLHHQVLEMDRLGKWEVLDSKGSAIQRGTSYLLSASESDIASAPTSAIDREPIRSGNGFGNRLQIWLLVFLLIILGIESWLFHRHAVY